MKHGAHLPGRWLKLRLEGEWNYTKCQASGQ